MNFISPDRKTGWGRRALFLGLTVLLGGTAFAEVVALRDEDFTYASVHYGEHPRQIMDVRLPKVVSQPVPVVVFVHGGSWKKGDRRSTPVPELVRRCDDEGFALVAVEYRFLADAAANGLQPPIRGPMADVESAIRFLQGRAAEWKLDLGRIGVTGGSAGGCAALTLALTGDNRLGIRAVAAAWPQTSLDPVEMKSWIPNIDYGAEAFGYGSFDEWLAHRQESWPWIKRFSPIAQLRKCARSRLPIFLFDQSTRLKAGELPKDPTHAGIFAQRFAAEARKLGGEVMEVPYGKLHTEFLRVLKAR